MISTDEIYTLVEERRAALGLSQAEVELRAFGKAGNGSVQNLRRGKAPGIEKLSALLESLGLEMYIGPPRDKVNRSNHETIALIHEFAFVDRFDIKLSAGPGANGDNARKLAPVAFRREWLSENGLKPDKCVVTGVSGNSMEPMLFDGDLVLLNRNRMDVRSGEIYGLVDIEGDVRIKRIERIKEGIILRSENPDCPSELRLGEDANRVSIIGSLAWSGHTHDPLRKPPPSAPTPVTFKHNWF